MQSLTLTVRLMLLVGLPYFMIYFFVFYNPKKYLCTFLWMVDNADGKTRQI